MLAVVTSVRPSMITGAQRLGDAARRLADLSAVVTFFSTTMNSSPPMRTTMSSVRMVELRMRCATAFSSLSPVSCRANR